MPAGQSVATAPLNEAALAAALVRPGSLWTDVTVVAQTGSTNADLMAQAARGSADGVVLVAEAQRAGRGRMGRTWVSAPRAALTFSVLLRPAGAPQSARGWLPLLTGVAVTIALRDGTGVGATLKWPNDVLADEGKLAGILAEQSGDAVVVGIGVNVVADRPELPVPGATSLSLLGAGTVDRTALLTGMLTEIERWYTGWLTAGGDAEESGLRAEYLRRCGTLGRQVRVELPGGRVLAGQAADVDGTGRLVVMTEDGPQAVSAGDVTHVR